MTKKKHNFERYSKDYKNIENYELAVADNFIGWDCHHRLETHTSDGEKRLVNLSRAELIALDMYYNRPASELIFMRREEHTFLHHRKYEYDDKKKFYAEHMKQYKKQWYEANRADISQYNKQINKSCKYGYSNICAYPEFFNYCLRHNLSAVEITILNYILSNTKEWEISPTTIGNVYNIPRETASRALTKLQSKLNGDLIISSRSKGGNGSLVNATKVYEEIYNEISRKKQLENPPEESEEITEETPLEKKITVKNIPDKLLLKYNLCVSKRPTKEIELWCRQNNIQYEIA